MTKIKISLTAALLTATATAILFTCEKAPDYCRGSNELYEPSCEFCFGGRAYTLCGKAKYNPLTNGCDTVNALVGTKCSDGSVVKSGTPCGGYTLTAAAVPEIGGTLIPLTLPTGPTYSAGQPVTLRATSNDEYVFAGWAGAQPSESRPIGNETTATYTMAGSVSQVTIVAMFKPRGKGGLITDAFPEGSGRVERSPDLGDEPYSDNARVTLTAREEPGYVFAGWSGSASGKTNPLQITMDESKTVVAMFSSVVHTLIAAAEPSEGGAVFINGTALARDSSQGVGTEIWVLAGAAPGYRFTRWSGTAVFADEKAPNTKATLSADASITAHFERGEGGGAATQAVLCTLTVNSEPADGGAVTLLPEQTVYRVGDRVTAKAEPKPGYEFTGWSGASNSQSAAVTITAGSGRMTLTAHFQQQGHVHDWGDWVVTAPATCEAAGVETRTCKLDGSHKDTRAIAKLTGASCNTGHVHDWGDWVVTVPATCEAAGVETRTCNLDANHKETQTIPKLTGSACNSGGGSSETVSLGGLKWMAKNLNVEVADSWCYDNSTANCNKYGRLYTWEAAKAACQSVGMRLPTRADWDALVTAAGGSSTAGKKLKSSDYWTYYDGYTGTDDFGFSALPGGGRYSDGSFGTAGNYGYWWTATESSEGGAYSRNMYYDDDDVNEDGYDKSDGFSARCVQD